MLIFNPEHSGLLIDYMVPIIDIFLIIFLAGFIFYGLFFGFIRTLGALAGLLGGAFIAVNYHEFAYGLVNRVFFGYAGLGKAIVFLILFTIANRLIVLVFSLINGAFDLVSIIPFLKTINRLVGALFGFLLGVSILGLFLYFVSSQPFLSGWFGKHLIDSKVMPYLGKIIGLIAFLIPGMLEKVNGLIKKI